LTSLDDIEFATNAVQQGAQDYLVKSDLSGQLLIRAIRNAIERKKTQEKLEAYATELARSNEHLQGFAHTVAHEVKSPLHVVATCLQVLEQSLKSQLDKEMQDLVRDASTAIRGMTESCWSSLALGAKRRPLARSNWRPCSIRPTRCCVPPSNNRAPK
jgi:FixJ family two-component response regulator